MANYTIGLAGLQNTSLAIDTTSNNIANANTVGYKAGDYVFADQYFKAVSPSDSNRVGLGSGRLAVRRPLTYGTINNSANPLDMAIGGDGWFRVLTNPNDPTSLNYTRNGQFAVDKNGWIVNENGMYLTGYQPSTDGTRILDDIRGSGSTNGKLKMPADFANGTQTDQSKISVTLDNRENAFVSGDNGSGVEFVPEQNTFNSQTTQTIYDSNGVTHTLNLYYRRVNDGQLTITVNSDGFSYSPGPNSDPNTSLYRSTVHMPSTQVLSVDSPLVGGKSGISDAVDPAGTTIGIASTTFSELIPAGSHIYVNGLDTGALTDGDIDSSNGPVTTFESDSSLKLALNSVISFYPAGDVHMQLVTPDGTKLAVTGASNNPALFTGGDSFDLTATTERVEVYASIDGRFYNHGDSETKSAVIGSADVVGAYSPIANLIMVQGRNIDSLVGDNGSGKPLFSSKATLSAKVSNGAQQSSLIDLTFDLDLSDTQLQASSFQMNASTQNGEPRSQLSSVSIDGNGMIVGVYGNGRQIVAGQIALAHFDASEQLVPTGGNSFAPSYRSGTEGDNGVRIGRPGEGSFGAIKSQAVEQSNVDLSNELVKLMLLQRVYSANSQSLRAFDQTMQDTIRMVG
jgi:flagellar hook protein FlgE